MHALAPTILALLATGYQAKKDELTLDQLYPEKSLLGKTARGMEWSQDDRYLAYLWNPYDVQGSDIWLYDTTTGTSSPLTSVNMMGKFDRATKEIAERYKKEAEEKAKRDKMTEEEKKKYDEEQKKKTTTRARGGDYGGVSSFEWAHSRNELLFSYKGDVYRMALGEDKPTRLTRTQEPETGLEYTKADDGYFFRRGDYVFRMKFASAYVEQLNPQLPNDMKMGFYSISPDETKLAIGCGRETGTDRAVTYISYRGRFAEAKTTNRGVADDNFQDESYLYLYDLNDDVEQFPTNDGKPWEIYKWGAGKQFGQTSLSPEPWSPDSKKFVFTTWKRDDKEFNVMLADTTTKKTESVLKETLNGGHTTPGRAVPFFTKDGSKIVINTDKSGFMQLWVVDPAAKTETQLTKGDFETEPIKLSTDGKRILVSANPRDPSRTGLYWASMDDGSLSPVANRDGNYGDGELNHKGDSLATVFRSWSSLPELYLAQNGEEKKLTVSQNEDYWKYQKIKPQLFSYKNRHGQTVRGYMYLPSNYKKGDKRPLWIYVYGGPLSSRGSDVKDGSFNNFNMYLAHKYGYITCTIDPRGMSGYGGAWESANWEAPGKAQVEDLSDGAKWFIQNYGCDPEKVGINGWSFGGFQTQMCMYTAPEVFKLGIAGAGPTEWQNYNTWYTGGVIGYSRSGNPADLDKYSLTKLAKNLQSPLMLLHGVEDTNVLYQDTVKVYQALLQAGKGPLVELVIDPTGGHGLGGDIKRKEQYQIYESFLARRWGAFVPKKR